MSEAQTAATTTDKIDTASAEKTATTADATKTATEVSAEATLASGKAQTATATAPVDWPSDWRQKLASENPDDIKTLERFTDPASLWKQNKELRTKLSTGEAKVKLPENPTPEQLAEYRKSIGVPEKADDYKIELPNGVVFSEADKPLVDSFKKAAHEANVDPKVFNRLLGWYTDQQTQTAAQRADTDNQTRAKNEEALRRDWGPEYKTADGQPGKNLTAIASLFADAPKGLFDDLMNARDPQGNLLGDRIDLIKHLAKTGRELFPTATLIPMGADAAKGALDRKADIEKLMGDKKSDYWKGPKSEALQSEYREILGSLERSNARRAA